MLQLVLFIAVLVLSLAGNDAFSVTSSSPIPLRQQTAIINNEDYGHKQPILTALFAVLDNSYDGSNNNYGDDGNENEGEGSMDYERYKAALEHNVRRTDVRIFLTQRAIQSFINLLITCRDPHTVRWLEVRMSRETL
eukprot:scaffold13527_cov202-Amphora_coffeaeformis.AAC.12